MDNIKPFTSEVPGVKVRMESTRRFVYFYATQLYYLFELNQSAINVILLLDGTAKLGLEY